MENKICKYYDPEITEIPGPFKPSYYLKHKCNKIIYNNNDEPIKSFKNCIYYKSFKDCNYYECD